MELTKPKPALAPATAAPGAVPVTPPVRSVNDIAAPKPAPKNDDMTVHEPTGPVDEPEVAKGSKKPDTAKPIKPKVEKTKTPGAGGAIFAAVVIILGLGAMMTYAYLRSQNISLF